MKSRWGEEESRHTGVLSEGGGEEAKFSAFGRRHRGLKTNATGVRGRGRPHHNHDAGGGDAACDGRSREKQLCFAK